MIVVLFFGSILLTTAVSNKQASQNLTCALGRIDFCYKSISALGANFTANYTESREGVQQLCNKTKRGNETVFPCLREVRNVCHVDLGDANINKVQTHVGQICNQSMPYGSDFLNFARCCNKLINERKTCVKKNTDESKKDNRTLCCERFKIVRCIDNVARKECGDYFAQTGTNIYNKYGIFHMEMCGSYEKECSGSSRNSILHLFTLFAAFVTTLCYTREVGIK